MQKVFKRFEKKYLITAEQAMTLQNSLYNYMALDKFDKYWVQNIYFDTDNWDVIHHSMQKPYYKEKMRLRCYNIPTLADNVFLELKKKYAGIVYKRRIKLPYEDIPNLNTALLNNTSQISKELNYYIQNNNVSKKIFISYRRLAFIGKEDKGLRITFDTDINYRVDQLDFLTPGDGYSILSQNKVLMEIKTSSAFPLWLVSILSSNNIFATSFSKYGTCFLDYQNQAAKEEVTLNARIFVG